MAEEIEIAGSSISSRIGIWLDSGLEQLLVNPVFGDLAVDHAVGRPGYYVHSVLTVQTHLGFVGSVLFFLPLIKLFIDLFRRKGFLFPKFSITLILLSSFFIEIFTWMPLWFAVGALYGLQAARSKGRRVPPAPVNTVDNFGA